MTNKLFNVIAEVLEVPPAAITTETGVANEEKWDSLRHMQIVFAVEDAFGIQFGEGEIQSLTSVQALTDALASQGINAH